MTRRDLLTSAAVALTPLRAAVPRKTKHIFLFTSDGVRWQELFNGMDPQLLGEKYPELSTRFMKSTPQERRGALMPFFWNTVVPRGVLLRNMQVANSYRVSYPGYSEILTGRIQDEVIRNNDPIQNPTPSFLQFLKQRSKLSPEQVAVFASWKVIAQAAESRKGDIFTNAGYQSCPVPAKSPKVAAINELQSDARYLDSSSRHDAFTFGLAMEYLSAIQPEHMYISFDESDDWAHNKRYDQVLLSLEYFDRSLRALWTYLQNSPKYRDNTTLVITTDHGRGSTAADWNGHGPKVPGDERIWAAFIGPDTPARGEIPTGPMHYQCDIAPTILQLLGVEKGSYAGMEGSAISDCDNHVA